MKYLDKLNEADRIAYAAATNAYARHSVLKYNLSKDELAELYGPGELVEHKSWALVLEDWAHLVEKATGENVGLLRYVGGRPLTEIHEKLSDGLESAGLRIDEYFCVSSDMRDEVWPDDVRRIAVFTVQGGSEGHYVHVDVYTGKGYEEHKVVSLFLLKTFAGMEHALRLANELTRMLDKAE